MNTLTINPQLCEISKTTEFNESVNAFQEFFKDYIKDKFNNVKTYEKVRNIVSIENESTIITLCSDNGTNLVYISIFSIDPQDEIEISNILKVELGLSY